MCCSRSCRRRQAGAETLETWAARLRNMPVYQTTFEIDAGANRVWKVLTTLDRYAEWNPQIPQASGILQKGATISLCRALPGRPVMNLSATIEEARPNELLTWRGHLVAPWFFEGHRKFAIEPIAGGRVRVTHVEDIHGLFAPVFSVVMGAPVEKSHRALNEALRVRAESSA
jgi:hypothetical protein